MESSKYEPARRVGQYGWLALAGFVAAWDILAPETLSNAFSRACENPRYRPLAIGALAVTGAHLLDLLPEQIDPFDNLVNGVTQLIHKAE